LSRPPDGPEAAVSRPSAGTARPAETFAATGGVGLEQRPEHLGQRPELLQVGESALRSARPRPYVSPRPGPGGAVRPAGHHMGGAKGKIHRLTGGSRHAANSSGEPVIELLRARIEV